MKLDEIQKRVQNIKNSAGDDEGAHWAEDSLYEDFVYWLSEGNFDEDNLYTIQTKAKHILETKNIAFERWCA